MFILGGALADRYGAKAPIIAGCLLRTAGFALLGFAADLPALLAASIATGSAGALFNRAVRALLAEQAGERRVEAFAVFNVYYQAGMVAGPVVGLGLLAVDFRVVCAVAAAVFAALTVHRLIVTHYGLYNTVCGLGITVGNLAVGSLWGWSGRHGLEPVTWLALAAIGFGAAFAVRLLASFGHLTPAPVAEPVPA